MSFLASRLTITTARTDVSFLARTNVIDWFVTGWHNNTIGFDTNTFRTTVFDWTA